MTAFCYMLGALVSFHLVRGQDNLIEKIRDDIRVSMSTTWRDFNASNAVDGNEGTEADTCRCCAGTTNSPPFWWRLDLGKEYLIKTINFIGRSDQPLQSRNFSIYKGFSNSSGQRLLHKNTALSGHQFTIPLKTQVALQYLEVTKSSGPMTICELKLVEGECQAGFFGVPCQQCGYCKSNDYCDKSTGNCTNGCQPGYLRPFCRQQCPDGDFGDPCQQCGHCNNNGTCDKATGHCSNGCQPGYIGSLCKQQCPDGEFGDPCQQCGYCNNNVTCDKATGLCSNGCQPGYIGSLCKQQCPDGEFGDPCQQCGYCTNNGTCDKATGHCSNGCQPGYIGSLCKQQCPDGKFGDPCQQCGSCENNDTCDKATGHCPNGCDPGYTGTLCSQQCPDDQFGYPCQQCGSCKNRAICNKVTGSCPNGCMAGYTGLPCDHRCPDGSFGLNCSLTCHCLQNVTCDHISGVCPEGSCASGWTGMDCNTVVEAIATDEGPSTVSIIGAVVGVLIMSLTVTIVVIIYRRRKRHPKLKLNQEGFSVLEGEKESDKTVAKKLSQRKQQRKNTNAKDAVDVATDHTYYAFESQAKKIPIHEIWNYINLAYGNDCAKLHQEFQKLPSGLVHDCGEARRPENAKKNRYKQMFAYDHSRVILKRDDPSFTTYINACYIDGYKKLKKFIASQGPMEAMVGDFWEMVIQENISIIIMLTNVVEHGVTKCIQYWPISKNETLLFGDITVLTSKIDKFPDYTVREIDISKEGEPTKRITQYHFTAWPDKDVPDTAWHLVNFWRKVNSVVQTIKEPVVVHCSAGIGRTGTFIGLDNMYAQANAEGYIQPFDIITRLRHQRVNMVQTKFQYVFLHEAVAEALHIGVKPVKANEFDTVYKLLLEPDNTAGVTGLEQQHRLIKENPTTISDETTEYCNVSSTKECDAYRPNSMRSSSPGNDDNFDMCHVHNYAGKDTYIVTTASNEDTVASLRKTIEKHNIKTVITLHNEIDRAETVPGKQSEEGHSKNAVQLTETKREKHFIEQTFTAKQSKSGKESRTIKQFMFLTTKDKTAKTASVISFLNAIQRWQPSVDESQPILITHENAYERCGLICLLLCEFERIRSKDSVNILATVKHLKDKNPRLIPDYEQYKLCYSAVAEYIRQSDVYMNV